MSPAEPPARAPSALKRPAAVAAPGTDEQLEAMLASGQALHGQGLLEEAHRAFGQAHRRRPSDHRCQSWYGLTLILVERNSNLGVRYCEEAVFRGAGAQDPAAWLNLGRAFSALGYRDRAVRAFQKGLDLAPEHPGLREEMEKLGVRRKPIIGFLDRRNPVNRMLGRLRHRFLGGPAGTR
ncbi:MAG: tetratricopeptide repeat protein [Myxococcales bacterium]